MPRPDLLLPDPLPEIAEYQSEGMDGKAFAVYAIAPAAALDLEAVCRICRICRICDEHVDEGIKQMRPASVTLKDRFVGKPLPDVVKFHRTLIRKDQSWDKLYFAVVTRDDWMEKGILLVTLLSTKEFKPDGFYVPAEEVGSNLISLQMVNTDCIEMRYGYESYHQARVAENEDNDRNDSNGDETVDAGRDEQKQGRRHQIQAPCFLVCDALYPPQSAHIILNILDPKWLKKRYKLDERFIEGQIPWERAYRTQARQIDTVWCADP